MIGIYLFLSAPIFIFGRSFIRGRQLDYLIIIHVQRTFYHELVVKFLFPPTKYCNEEILIISGEEEWRLYSPKYSVVSYSFMSNINNFEVFQNQTKINLIFLITWCTWTTNLKNRKNPPNATVFGMWNYILIIIPCFLILRRKRLSNRKIDSSTSASVLKSFDLLSSAV